jgi:hypothetical protein
MFSARCREDAIPLGTKNFQDAWLGFSQVYCYRHHVDFCTTRHVAANLASPLAGVRTDRGRPAFTPDEGVAHAVSPTRYSSRRNTLASGRRRLEWRTGYSLCGITNLTSTGTESHEHVAVFIVCILHDRLITAGPYWALCILRTANKALLIADTINTVNVRFEALTVVVMNVAIFCDKVPCSPYVNRRFGGKHRLQPQGKKQPNKKPACSRWLDNCLVETSINIRLNNAIS